MGEALLAIEQALEARRNRIRLSQAEIAPIQWIVIVVLAVLVLSTLAMIHIEIRLAMAVTMFIFSTAVALCLVLLMVYDRPFGAGGFIIEYMEESSACLPSCVYAARGLWLMRST